MASAALARADARVGVRQSEHTTALRALTSTTSARQMSAAQYLLELTCHCWARLSNRGDCSGQAVLRASLVVAPFSMQFLSASRRRR
ncbi:hypothetical protein C6341_g9385 [Phytophthora cactorum]|nr:hypothetical protein C6341_g9385 [Phytophthora cactorum]